jgi:hypothetical protein
VFLRRFVSLIKIVFFLFRFCKYGFGSTVPVSKKSKSKSRHQHESGRSRQRSGKSSSSSSSSNYNSSQRSVSTRTTEASSRSGRSAPSAVRSISNRSVSSIAGISKLLKPKKTSRTIDLYDDDELAKAWHRERAQNKRRELKARTPSPDTTATEESSDCSREDEQMKSLDYIVGLDTETAWKSISFEETEQTTSTSEEETEVTTEEEETFAAENKFVVACEKTLHTPLQGCLVFVDWWNGCV